MKKRSSDNAPKERSAEEALQTLQWLCSRMERSENDARRSMYRWQVPREDWDGVITRLVEERYIDNERYASAYVREKVQLSGWGTTKIKNGLRTKGISSEIIERVMTEYATPSDMAEKLESYIDQRIKKERPKAKNSYDLRVRVFRGAASRGYNFEQINDILDRKLKDED